ncbi:hypothetical protein GCM10011571_12860 [Marinithermofilum abyssi]|uniref:DUF2339 domain-containing protein n=1 Tax=Marinithermofilum abyssi TaxID=1571185 RepID=A0A8J2VBT5_9BACL|nr:DUF2339 domain-containing protein [Marinithermofilum abyssi]GGE12883.1 hypothetical protein GCM10011571_12860 [Marinithermofilum abyssi]
MMDWLIAWVVLLLFCFFVLGGCVLYLLIRQRELAFKLQRLEQEWKQLPQVPSPPLEPSSVRPSETSRKFPASDEHVEPLFPSVPRWKESWELFIGGKLLNRIGSVMLFAGMVFFLQYAFKHEWIGEGTRVLLGGAVGVLLTLAGGKWQRKGMGVFGQGISGAGIAVLYSSVYASFNWYQLLPQWMALGLMSAVTVLALVHAFRYRALAMAFIGGIGGFLTPFMLAGDQSHAAGLLGYILILTAGLLWLSKQGERWELLSPFTLAGVVICWLLAEWLPGNAGIKEGFLTAYWLMLLGWERWILAGKSCYVSLHRVVSVVNALFWTGGTALALADSPDWASAVWYAMAAGVYGWAARLDAGRWEHRLYIIYSVSLLGCVLLWLSDGWLTLILWAVGAGVLHRKAVQMEAAYLWRTARVFLGLTAAGWLTETGLDPLADAPFLFNGRTLSLLFLMGVMVDAARRSRVLADRESRWWRTAFRIALALLGFLGCTAEVNGWFGPRMDDLESGSPLYTSWLNRYQLSLSGMWTLYSVLLMVLGMWRKQRLFRLSAIGLFGITLLKIVLLDLSFLDTLYRILAFLLFGTVLLVVSYVYQKRKDGFQHHL